MATTTTRRVRDVRRARYPVTAVFPTRLPVPMMARDGVSTGVKTGGSRRKSAPSYGYPEREHAAGEPHALDRAEHGLVRQVDDRVRAELLECALDALAQRYPVALAAA